MPGFGMEWSLNMKLVQKALACAIVIAASATAALAQLPVNRPVDLTNVNPGAASAEFSTYNSAIVPTTVADSFTLPVTVPGDKNLVSTLKVYGYATDLSSVFNPTSLTNFEINFLDNASGVPGSVIATRSFTAATSSSFVGNTAGAGSVPVYELAFDFSSNRVDLGNGGTFWLSFGASDPGNAIFVWNLAGSNPLNSAFKFGAGGWQSDPNNYAFQINGDFEAIPEPATMSVLALAAWLKSRRKSKKA